MSITKENGKTGRRGSLQKSLIKMALIVFRNQGISLIALGIFAILVYVLFRFLWLIGIALILLGFILFIIGLIKRK